MIKLWFSRNLKKAIAKIMLLFSAIDEDMDQFENSLTDMQENVVRTTLDASKWSNGEYSFEDIYPVSTYKHIRMDFDYDNGTDYQRSLYRAADICPSSTSNKVYLKGTVPSVDIPIVLTIRRGQ